uniref:Ig-like domain-containing protein n=1 Tax=Podarcis muralis TaxID=64176 RepID=A0A670JHS9_PODMU
MWEASLQPAVFATHNTAFAHARVMVWHFYVCTIGFLGKEAILPCQLTTSSIPESTSIQVQWILEKSSEKIDVKSYYGRNRPETQDNRYRGRAELSRTDLSKGNMSLILKKTHLNDQGNYTCIVFLGDWFYDTWSNGKLICGVFSFAAKGTEPTIALVDYKGWGIGLTCSSNGWYPKPKAFWLDSEGKVRSKLSDTTITETKAGNFSVSRSVTTESGVDHEVSSEVGKEEMNTQKWGAPGGGCLAVARNKGSGCGCVMGSSTVGFTETSTAPELNMVSFLPVIASLIVPVTLDSYYKHPEISISEDKERASLQTLPPEKEETALRSQIFVGKEGYAAGKHYWEVEVGERLDWELGVLTKAERYKFRVEKVVKSFGEGCWALKSIQGKFFSSPCEKEIEKKENVSYSVIGLLLDQEKWEISFYNSRGAYFLIDSIPIKSSDKLYPFLDCGSASENSGPKPSEKSNVSENSGPKTLRKSFANIVKKYLLEK